MRLIPVKTVFSIRGWHPWGEALTARSALCHVLCGTRGFRILALTPPRYRGMTEVFGESKLIRGFSAATRGLVPEPHIVQGSEGHEEVLDSLCCHRVTNQNSDATECRRGRGAPGTLILLAGTQTVQPLRGALWPLLTEPNVPFLPHAPERLLLAFTQKSRRCLSPRKLTRGCL